MNDSSRKRPSAFPYMVQRQADAKKMVTDEVLSVNLEETTQAAKRNKAEVQALGSSDESEENNESKTSTESEYEDAQEEEEKEEEEEDEEIDEIEEEEEEKGQQEQQQRKKPQVIAAPDSSEDDEFNNIIPGMENPEDVDPVSPGIYNPGNTTQEDEEVYELDDDDEEQEIEETRVMKPTIAAVAKQTIDEHPNATVDAVIEDQEDEIFPEEPPIREKSDSSFEYEGYPEEEEEEEDVTNQKMSSIIKATIKNTSYRMKNIRKKKKMWTEEETNALEEGLYYFKAPFWSDILKYESQGLNRLADRNSGQLKDRARTVMDQLEKLGVDLSTVTAYKYVLHPNPRRYEEE